MLVCTSHAKVYEIAAKGCSSHQNRIGDIINKHSELLEGTLARLSDNRKQEDTVQKLHSNIKALLHYAWINNIADAFEGLSGNKRYPGTRIEAVDVLEVLKDSKKLLMALGK